MYTLTREETETNINYNDAEDMAQVYTCNKALIRRIEKMMQNTSTIIEERRDECSRTYLIPKKYIKVQIPRFLTEEKRKELSERAKRNFGK